MYYNKQTYFLYVRVKIFLEEIDTLENIRMLFARLCVIDIDQFHLNFIWQEESTMNLSRTAFLKFDAKLAK